MMKAQRKSLAYQKMGDGYVPVANVSAKQKMSFSVNSGGIRIRASTLLFINRVTKRTSYYIFLVHSTKEANWYAEIECTVESEHYSKHKSVFEKDIARSIKINEEMVK